jgi:HSP20 family protein
MAEPASKTPTQAETANAPQSGGALSTWRPFDSLHREIDRLFEDFGRGFWRSPFGRDAFDLEPLRRLGGALKTPAVDILDKAEAYEITADLPGLDEKNIDVQLVNGTLTIKGGKTEEKEEEKENYYLKERHFGSFERSFTVPQDVEAEKIHARFEKGVLTVTLPKTAAAQKPAKKIDVKAA